MLIAKCHQRIEQYLRFLEKKRYEHVASLSLEVTEMQEHCRTVPQNMQWTPIKLPFQYGKAWTTYWFRTRYCVREREQSRELYLHFTPHAETLVFVNGTPVSAINILHEKLKLTDSATPGEKFDIALETYSGHPYPGMHPFSKTSIMVSLETSPQFPQYPLILSDAAIIARNQAIYDLYYDVWALFELARQLPDNSLRQQRILQTLFSGLSRIYFTADDATLHEQVKQASDLITPLLHVRNSPTTPQLHAIGHAHIDHGWLWPIRETHRKVARTFAGMTQYAKEFQDFIFIQSQPAQLEAVHEHYPAIFEQVKQAYQRGQWEPNGGMYVEADCNLPNGESLIRQFLIGRLTSEALLDYRSDTLWLPDVFGYAANLPQILEGCGIDYFVTSKINWNDTTRFPYDTFLWRGIDGTAAKTHYITVGYNGKMTPEHAFDAWNQVQHKEIQSSLIFPIGEGDGGGGTMRSDLELAKRMRDLEGCPKVSWKRVSDALKEIFRKTGNLPEWRGELYLELHRGTYTSQAATKKWNRTLEYKLRDTELLATLVMPSMYRQLFRREGGLPYPAEKLLVQWKILLINQFHDIIPGSSIKAVYEDAVRSYEAIHRELATIEQTSKTALYDIFDTSKGERPLICFNSLSWERTSKATIPAQHVPESPVLVSDGHEFPVQATRNFGDSIEYLSFVDIPSMGGRVYYVEPQAHPAEHSPFRYGGKILDTPFYRVQFDDAMRIVSLIHTETGKEYVKSGMAFNTLQTAEDLPVCWDAWDIDVDYQLKLKNAETLLSTEVISHGPAFIQIRNQYQVGKESTLLQDIFFYAHQQRIDFVTRVHWQEDHQLLKVLFPVNIHAEKAKCEIQYGHVERNTHTNTMADRAQFEFCAHKWVAVDDGSFGAALLNDCKYGYDVNGTDIRLTLLKSAKAPDPEADLGVHDFTYAFLPYQGKFAVENVVRSGYDLNIPLTIEPIASKAGVSSSYSFFQLDNPNIILETVKKAEKEEAVILRLYDASGGEQAVRLKTALKLKNAIITNMQEEDVQETAIRDNGLDLVFRSFEIKTIKLFLV